MDQVSKEEPIRQFPDKEYLHSFVNVWKSYPLIANPKARRMTMSWTTIGLYVWDAIFHKARHIAFVSKKEDDANELVKRALFIIEHLDKTKLLADFIPKYTYKYNNLEFPEIMSKIQGFPQGADQLRAFTFSGIFGDESAFWEYAEKFYSASFPTLDGGGRMTLVSSPAPGFFKKLCFDAMGVPGDINVAEYTPDAKQPMQGVRVWLNKKNRFLVFELHYTADEGKRHPDYKESIKNSMPYQEYMREYELHWDTFEGQPVYPEFGPIHVLHKKPKPSAGLPMMIGIDFGLCYDDKTEVLTKAGWKFFKDVSDKEEVATLNPNTHRLEYVIPKFKVEMPYKGRMINYDGDAMSFSITPDHIVPVWYDKHEFRRYYGRDIMKYPRHKYFRLTANYKGKDAPNELGLPADVYAAFMGAYLSEGNTDYGKVQISQKKELKWLHIILEKTGFKYKQNSQGFIIHSVELENKLKKYGKAFDKYIPDCILNGSRTTMQAFVDAYTLGDGHIRVRDNGAAEHTVFTVSKDMADGMSILALKLGWHSSISIRKPQTSYMKSEDRYIQSSGGYAVTFKKRADYAEPVRENFSESDYDGTVYCLSVPNSILYVRKNGRPQWNGNTPAAVIGQYDDGVLTVFKEYVEINMGAVRFMEKITEDLRLLYPTHSDFKNQWKCFVDPAGFQRNDNDERQTAMTVAKYFNPAPGAVSWEARRLGVVEFLLRLNLGNPTFQLYSAECPVLHKGFEGGYRFPEKAVDIEPNKLRPIKDAYSHPHDALQYLCGGVKYLRAQIKNAVPTPKYATSKGALDVRSVR